MKWIQKFMIAALLMVGAAARAQAPDIDSMDIVTRSVPDGPVAIIGKATVERIDFVLLYQAKLAQYAARSEKEVVAIDDMDRVKIGLASMTELIEQELLYQYALEQGITVEKDVVKEQAQRQYDILKENFTEAAGREVTDAEILQRLSYEKRSDIDDEVERSMIVTKMREQIVREHVTNMTPEELDRIYEKNVDKLVKPEMIQLKQIFISGAENDDKARTEAEKKANTALGRVFSGQRFESVAEEYSDLPQQIEVEQPMSRIPEYLAKPLASLKPGDVSEVIPGPHGYHIIMLVGSEQSEKMTKDQADVIIRKQKAIQEGGTVIRDFCAKLIEEGKNVTVFLELQRNVTLLNGAAEAESR